MRRRCASPDSGRLICWHVGCRGRGSSKGRAALTRHATPSSPYGCSRSCRIRSLGLDCPHVLIDELVLHLWRRGLPHVSVGLIRASRLLSSVSVVLRFDLCFSFRPASLCSFGELDTMNILKVESSLLCRFERRGTPWKWVWALCCFSAVQGLNAFAHMFHPVASFEGLIHPPGSRQLRIAQADGTVPSRGEGPIVLERITLNGSISGLSRWARQCSSHLSSPRIHSSQRKHSSAGPYSFSRWFLWDVYICLLAIMDKISQLAPSPHVAYALQTMKGATNLSCFRSMPVTRQWHFFGSKPGQKATSVSCLHRAIIS